MFLVKGENSLKIYLLNNLNFWIFWESFRPALTKWLFKSFAIPVGLLIPLPLIVKMLGCIGSIRFFFFSKKKKTNSTLFFIHVLCKTPDFVRFYTVSELHFYHGYFCMNIFLLSINFLIFFLKWTLFPMLCLL